MYGYFFTDKAVSTCPYYSSVTPNESEQVVLDCKLNSSSKFHFDHYVSNKMANLSVC
jgi:hypothetical protein